MIRGFRSFISNGEHYLIVPQRAITQNRIQEIIHMSEFLKYVGEEGIAELYPTLTSQPNAYIEGDPVLLFRIPKSTSGSRKHASLGIELANFHERGKEYPAYSTESFLFGQWAELWMKRVEETKARYNQVKEKTEKNDFDELFLTTFPYYEGLSENAIQYMVDHHIDNGPFSLSAPSICHDRFTEQSWIPLEEAESGFVKLPTSWVVDHPMRDLAEYIRSRIYDQDYRSESLLQFLDDYERISPITKESWRLLYGRLLFPVHYYEMIEAHYNNERDIGKELYMQRFFEYINAEDRNERFLRSFFPTIGLPVDQLNIPVVDWLIDPALST